MQKILLVFGTRPEAIKMAPVLWKLRNHSAMQPLVCVTAQHREMLDLILQVFDISPNYDLDLMQVNQTLADFTTRTILALTPVFSEVMPDWVLVQGDTTTVLAASIAAFYQGIKVGHIEAGLRTHNKRAPFPEEINRRLTSVIADLHFAPTPRAAEALRSEGINNDTIHVTGNTVIDSLLWMRDRIRQHQPLLPSGLEQILEGKRVILVTGHRRENFGYGFEQICLALKDIVTRFDDVCVVYPVHLNPNIQAAVYSILGDVENCILIDPLPYDQFVWLMDKAYLVLTDSGGIQEEAPSLGKPVLVMRETTERPEAIESGNAKLLGIKRDKIVEFVSEVLVDESLYLSMTKPHNPFGDGNAAERIVDALCKASGI